MNTIDTNTYVAESERTEKKFPNGLVLDQKQAELLHAAMGLVTEAGELMDQLKKHFVYGKPLDETNILEELGDSMWYMAIVCRLLKKEMGEVQFANLAKLRERFPNKFTEIDALFRDLDKERASLDANLQKTGT